MNTTSVRDKVIKMKNTVIRDCQKRKKNYAKRGNCLENKLAGTESSLLNQLKQYGRCNNTGIRAILDDVTVQQRRCN